MPVQTARAMRRVKDELEAVAAGNSLQFSHWRRVTKVVDSDNSAGPCSGVQLKVKEEPS